MTKQTIKRLGLVGAFLITFGMSIYADAAQYFLCASKDVKTCTQELTKGQSITEKAKNPKAVILKTEFQKFDLDKGTLKADKD